jgi:hypothetical protein
MNTTQAKLIADKTTAAACAFRTWSELELAMRGGYLPTLRLGTPKVDALARLITKNGYSFWNANTGTTVNPR